MQKLEVIVAPECFDAVVRALGALRVGPLHVTQTARLDPTRQPNRAYRGVGYSIGSPRMKLEMVLEPHAVKRAIEAVRTAGIAADGRGPCLTVVELRDAFDESSALRTVQLRPKSALAR